MSSEPQPPESLPPESPPPNADKKRFGGVVAILVASFTIFVACAADFLYLNPYRSLFASIPSIVYAAAAFAGGLVGWYWAHRASSGKPIAAVFGGLAVSIAAVAVVIAGLPRLDQWTSKSVGVAYQFTDRGVYRRVQPPHDERHPSYFLLREHDVKAYNQFLVIVIDGKLGTYVNFNTLIPLGKR